MSDYPMLISNKLHSFRNFVIQKYNKSCINKSYSIINLYLCISKINSIYEFNQALFHLATPNVA